MLGWYTVARLPRCRYPACKAVGKPVKLPFSDRWTSVCDMHRGPAFLAVMAGLVAHG